MDSGVLGSPLLVGPVHGVSVLSGDGSWVTIVVWDLDEGLLLSSNLWYFWGLTLSPCGFKAGLSPCVGRLLSVNGSNSLCFPDGGLVHGVLVLGRDLTLITVIVWDLLGVVFVEHHDVLEFILVGWLHVHFEEGLVRWDSVESLSLDVSLHVEDFIGISVSLKGSDFPL